VRLEGLAAPDLEALAHASDDHPVGDAKLGAEALVEAAKRAKVINSKKKCVRVIIVCLLSLSLHSPLSSPGELTVRLLNILNYRTKQLSHAPGLCNAAARRMWSVAIEDFRNLTETRFMQMLLKVLQPRQC